MYVPVQSLALPAPRAVIELTKCDAKQVAQANAAAAIMVYLVHLSASAMTSIAPT